MSDTRSARLLLRETYEANGYVRVKMDKRRAGLRSGWEVRLIAANDAEAAQLTAALQTLGLRAGKHFEKRGSVVVPLYGHDAVTDFLRTVRPRVKSSVPDFPDDTDARRRFTPSGASGTGRSVSSDKVDTSKQSRTRS